MPRYRTGTVEAYVEVDIDDLLDQVTDRDLLAEITERNLSAKPALLDQVTDRDLLAEITERNLSAKPALLAAVEAEHAEAHPWGPTWLCRAGVCGRIDWQEQS